MSKEKRNHSTPALVCGEIGLVHSLGIEGIPVFAGSNVEKNTAFYSRYAKGTIRVPDYETERFIETLCEFGANRPHKTVLITDDDQAALAISRNREKLENDFLFLLPDRKTVETIQDKYLFHKKAKELDLPVPVSYMVSSLEELDSIHSELIFPCILKPVNKEDWWHKSFQEQVGPYQKAFRCSSREELYETYKKIFLIHPKVIVQESIEGKDDQHYSVNMYINHQGDTKGCYAYQKIRMCPPGAGRGSFFMTVQEQEILEKAREVAAKLGMKGLVNIQFKRDIRSGALKLIEMEPRLSVSNFLGPAAGANLAASYYYDLVGENVPSIEEYRTGVKYSDLFRDIKAFFQYRKQGRLSFIEWLQSYKRNVVCNGHMFKDPWPILMSIWFIISKRFGQSDSGQR